MLGRAKPLEKLNSNPGLCGHPCHMSLEAAVTPNAAAASSEVSCRAPVLEDASRVWQLVADTQSLELNTAYAYLLMCTHFSDTSVVVEEGGALVGFVFAYRPPTHPEALFVWQVGVDPAGHGRGVASRMLDHLLARPTLAGVTHLEATVTPDNESSRALFRSFARRHHAPLQIQKGFGRDHFPGESHPPEDLFRIGPIRRTP